MPRDLRSPLALALVGVPLVLVGCGSRSGLLDTLAPPPSSEAPGGGTAWDDAGIPGWSPPPVVTDGGPVFGGSGTPVSDRDADIPTIDAAIPEAGVACPQGAPDRVAYLVSGGGTFYTYDPASLHASPVGHLTCPTSSSPFTMTVTETSAYVLFLDNSLTKVDLATLACTATPFQAPAGYGGSNFGLASTYAGGKEWLYIYGCASSGINVCVPTLSRVDPVTFAIDVVGVVAPFPPSMTFPAEMKADAYGRLFVLDYPGNLLEIANADAHVLAYDATGFALPDNGEALLTWNGLLYFFGGPSGLIDRYDLATRTLVPLGQVGDEIVGAGAAPCTH